MQNPVKAVSSILGLSLLLMLGCNPASIVDQPSTNLDVILHVLDSDSSPSDGKLPVFMQFFFNGSRVELSSNNAVTCNGIPLTWQSGLGYGARVPLVAANGPYTFSLSRNNGTTSAVVTARSRPVITSPAAGSTVPRSNNLTITYGAGTGIGVRAGASDGGSNSFLSEQKPDNGTYGGLDVSGFNAGGGKISLNRYFEENMPAGGFHSVKLKYTSGVDINVTWN